MTAFRRCLVAFSFAVVLTALVAAMANIDRILGR